VKSVCNFLPINQWFSSNNYPLIIAGPCSAENRAQIIDTAKALAKTPQIHAFRAGVWKPRTRPGGFQGNGITALDWMSEARDITGMRLITEVASPEHVESCLKYKMDMLWIGARTTSNPFSVNEIAAALKGVNIPILVKNPLVPDVNLWLGAVERIALAGINKIAAVHRGFKVYEKTPYRYAPIWEIPIELKQICPELPILCDPSHIAGNTELIYDISQRALNLNFCGLMIESHINPKSALSDAEQQLDVKELAELLSKLSYKNSSGDSLIESKLEDLRLLIDDIDNQLLLLLKQRMDVVEKMGKCKKEKNISILQIKRWQVMLENRMCFAQKLNLDTEFVRKLMKTLHEASIQLQQKILSVKD